MQFNAETQRKLKRVFRIFLEKVWGNGMFQMVEHYLATANIKLDGDFKEVRLVVALRKDNKVTLCFIGKHEGADWTVLYQMRMIEKPPTFELLSIYPYESIEMPERLVRHVTTIWPETPDKRNELFKPQNKT